MNDIFPPVLKYAGLTLILSHPGRFDKLKLIDGYAGREVDDALRPLSRHCVEIRTMSCKAPLREGTKVVLLCGETCLPHYLGELPSRINQLRGSPYERNGIIYIPTYHTQDAYDRQEYETRLNPALNAHAATHEEIFDDEAEESDSAVKGKGRTSRSNYGFWLRQDIQKAVRICKQGLHRNSCTYVLRAPIELLLQSIRSLWGKRVYFDIETIWGTDQMSCFSVSADAHTVTSVSLINYSGTLTYGSVGTRRILRELAGLFAKCQQLVVHNAQFDLFILAYKYRIAPPAWNKIEDTMLMHARTYVGVEKSLGHCVTLYTDQPYHKDEGIFNPQTYDQETALLTYNAKDVETLALVHSGILEHGKRTGTLTSQTQANECLRAYLGMSLRGIALDNDALCAHIDALRKRAEWFESKVLSRLAGFDLNPRSPKQVAAYLYDMLKLPRPKGNASPTGKGTLYKLMQRHDIPALRMILYLRRLSKDAGTLSFPQWKDARATCVYQIAGTKSGRLASKALLGRWGTNLQNLNKERCRRFFVPDPGMELVQVDQSGAEALIVTMMTKPGSNLRRLMQAGIKTHTYFAMHLFAEIWQDRLFKGTDSHIRAFLDSPIENLASLPRWKELEKCIKDSDKSLPSERYYHHAKMGVHGGNYGIAEARFIDQVLDKSDGEIVLTLAQGRTIINKLHEVFPEIRRDFQAYVRAQLDATGTLKNLFGYPRTFYHYGRPIDDVLVREAFSYIPQSTVGIITSMCIAELQAALDSGVYEGFEILANTHDSVLVQCEPTHTEQVKLWIKNHMNRQLTSPYGEIFHMKSDATVGKNWEMKE